MPQVRVIDADGKQLGVMNTRDALKLAMEAQLDLVEVAPNATPPVCRIMDFGKYQYEKSKKEKEGRKKTHTVSVKEIRLRPKTDTHDLETKLKQAKKFLEQKNKVKFSVIFKGRELSYKDMGKDLLEEVVRQLEEDGAIEQPIKMEGRRMTLLLTSKH